MRGASSGALVGYPIIENLLGDEGRWTMGQNTRNGQKEIRSVPLPIVRFCPCLSQSHDGVILPTLNTAGQPVVIINSPESRRSRFLIGSTRDLFNSDHDNIVGLSDIMCGDLLFAFSTV